MALPRYRAVLIIISHYHPDHAEFGWDLRESARAFKGIICDDISEFESYMPSHAVGSLRVADRTDGV
jgi:glyoxylase-like metal-dependent hydrolase (beta-lactamase superfamily II)